MLHGLLLINKPSGMTSHDVVARVRRILGTKSVGHTGTLDPMASGLMVLLIGEATKLSQYILEQNKAYRLKALFGKTTDTLDITGQILSTSDQRAEPAEVTEQILKLCGPLELPVPLFSATKIGGKKLYEYAREEKEVQIPMKTMTFFDLKIESQTENEIEVSMRCSKGSFVRSWVHRLGEILQVGAVLSALVRTESMPYFLENAITLEELEQLKSPEFFRGFIPMVATLPTSPLIRIKGQDQVMIGNGLISHGLKSQLIGAYRPGQESLIKIVAQSTGELLALVGMEIGKGFVIRRVFRYDSV